MRVTGDDRDPIWSDRLPGPTVGKVKMESSWAAVIVAAGKGRRMHSEQKKQFLPLGDKPVLVHTLEAISRVGRFNPIVVVVGAEDVEYVEQMREESWDPGKYSGR